MSKRSLSALAFAAFCLSAGAACAEDLVYAPINPSFGGNPFNSGHLLGVANAQNDHQAPSRESQADQFVRLLQSRLLSSLATQVSDAIFGENSQPTGQIVYGAQTVTWETLLDSIRLTIADAATGSETIIEIPVIPPGG